SERGISFRPAPARAWTPYIQATLPVPISARSGSSRSPSHGKTSLILHDLATTAILRSTIALITHALRKKRVKGHRSLLNLPHDVVLESLLRHCVGRVAIGGDALSPLHRCRQQLIRSDYCVEEAELFGLF